MVNKKCGTIINRSATFTMELKGVESSARHNFMAMSCTPKAQLSLQFAFSLYMLISKNN